MAETLETLTERLDQVEKTIAEVEPLSIEELRKSMARHGIRAEDNEFSRAIIEEREK